MGQARCSRQQRRGATTPPSMPMSWPWVSPPRLSPLSESACSHLNSGTARELRARAGSPLYLGPLEKDPPSHPNSRGGAAIVGSQADSQHTLERAGPGNPVTLHFSLRGGRAIPKTTRRLQWVLPTLDRGRGAPLRNHALKLGSSPHPFTPRQPLPGGRGCCCHCMILQQSLVVIHTVCSESYLAKLNPP